MDGGLRMNSILDSSTTLSSPQEKSAACGELSRASADMQVIM